MKYNIFMLCVECKKIYKFDFGTNFILAMALIGSSLGMFTPFFYNDSYHPKTKLVVSAIAIPIFILGLIILSGINKKERNCKVCNGKKTLIRLDTPEAIEIIKEYDLSFPDKSQEEDKFPWETKS